MVDSFETEIVWPVNFKYRYRILIIPKKTNKKDKKRSNNDTFVKKLYQGLNEINQSFNFFEI